MLGNTSEALGNRSEMPGTTSEALGNTSETLGNRSEMLGNTSETLGDRSEMPGNASETLGNRSGMPGNASEAFGNMSETLGNTSEMPERRPVLGQRGLFAFVVLRSRTYFAATGGFGAVIIGKSSVRKGVTGRPFIVVRLQTGLSAQA